MKINYGELWNRIGEYPAKITYYLKSENEQHIITEKYEMEDFYNKMKSRQIREFYVASSRVFSDSLELTVSIL